MYLRNVPLFVPPFVTPVNNEVGEAGTMVGNTLEGGVGVKLDHGLSRFRYHLTT